VSIYSVVRSLLCLWSSTLLLEIPLISNIRHTTKFSMSCSSHLYCMPYCLNDAVKNTGPLHFKRPLVPQASVYNTHYNWSLFCETKWLCYTLYEQVLIFLLFFIQCFLCSSLYFTILWAEGWLLCKSWDNIASLRSAKIARKPSIAKNTSLRIGYWIPCAFQTSVGSHKYV